MNAVMLLSLASTTVGCAGKGTDLDANGRPLSESGGIGVSGDALTADFASIQDHIFTPICTTCHAGAGAPQGLRLDSANSYNLLVGIPSTEVPTIQRVKVGDPDSSYIVQKLEGHAAVGARMPFGLPPLSTDQIAAIRQWITNGAQRPVAATPASVAFSVTTTAPASDDVLDAAPMQLIIGFNHELDATQITTQSVRLERRIDDGTSVNYEPIVATITLPTITPMSLLLTPAQPLSDGHYRVVMPTSANSISDNNGVTLGVPMHTEAGDALIVEFDVETQR
jgi:methionine-rich copper-binding protein CopC